MIMNARVGMVAMTVEIMEGAVELGVGVQQVSVPGFHFS